MYFNRLLHSFDGVGVAALRGDPRRVLRLLRVGSQMFDDAPEAGAQVRVQDGLFEGVEGTVVRRLDDSRMLVAVHLIQPGVSLEIDARLLEVIA
jgi:transcriptional antiterminator RfaH